MSGLLSYDAVATGGNLMLSGAIFVVICDSLLDDVGPETISSILESFQEISISCTHTLQEVIGLLFDHAIADPLLW